MASRSENRPTEDKPRVLVTGLSGFTGWYVEQALRDRGYEAIDPLNIDPQFDLSDSAGVTRLVDDCNCQYVIHLAAISFVAHGNALDFYRVNTIGTINLLEALAKAKTPVKKAIIASSANIYGNTPLSPITEDTVPQPVNHYACSKLSMEHLVQQWFHRLPILMTRPFNYTGPGQTPNFLVPKIVSHFASRQPRLELGNTDVVRDFSDVRFVAEAYAELLTSPVNSQAVNICSGQGRSLQWILDECTRLTGHRPEISVNPAFVRADEVKVLIGSADKLNSLIKPRNSYDLSTTLQWMLNNTARSTART